MPHNLCDGFPQPQGTICPTAVNEGGERHAVPARYIRDLEKRHPFRRVEANRNSAAAVRLNGSRHRNSGCPQA